MTSKQLRKIKDLNTSQYNMGGYKSKYNVGGFDYSSDKSNQEMSNTYSNIVDSENTQYSNDFKKPKLTYVGGKGVDKHSGLPWKEATRLYKENTETKYKSVHSSRKKKPADYTYNEAFHQARANYEKTFTHNGKEYSTRLEEETVDQFNKSFVKGSPEYKARFKEISDRRRIGLTGNYTSSNRSGLPGSTAKTYNAGGVRSYEVGGSMYSDNTVSSAGQGNEGTTSNIVYQESNPQLQMQRELALLEQNKKMNEDAAIIEQQIEAEKQQSEVDISNAKIESDANFAKGEMAVGQGLDKGSKLFKGLKDFSNTRQGLGAAKALGTIARPGTGYIDLGNSGQRMSMTPNYNFPKPTPTIGTPGPGELSLNSLSPDSAFTPGAGSLSSNTGVNQINASTNYTPPTLADAAEKTQGFKSALNAYNTQRTTNQAINAGGLGVKSSALGAGWKGLGSAGKANLIGTAATLTGEGIKKWGPKDNDDTELNTSEWSGELLSGAGTGIGMAGMLATAGTMAGYGTTLGPIGTAVGGALGLGYGAYKALAGRKKAREAEAEYNLAMEKKVNKFNEGYIEDLSSQKARINQGNIDQKTYSGYDLGRNVIAQRGGYRNMPQYI